jgi:fatty-acid desaturase
MRNDPRPEVDETAGAPVRATRSAWRVKWRYATPVIVTHVVAALAFVPWFFSWTGVVIALVGCYVFGTLGMNIGYHRLLTHRGFSAPRWLERTLAVLGVCCLQESPTVWAALHRRHHHVADKEGDPHSPLAGFLWGHVGWLVLKSDHAEPGPAITRYASDLTSEPFYAWLEVHDNWIKVALLAWAAFFAAGFLIVTLAGGTSLDAVRFGASLLVWGGAVRTVLVWHLTWAVNSVTHLWGYRSYDTPDGSRNNAILALLNNGEGWHNNHHADPRSARHGHAWWEFDLAWLTIRLLARLGLARDVSVPSRELLAARKN